MIVFKIIRAFYDWPRNKIYGIETSNAFLDKIVDVFK
jgi:hypothetical protein